jgi:hypothetical protein
MIVVKMLLKTMHHPYPITLTLILGSSIAILLKLHGWMLSIHTTKMDCASLQQFSRSDNNATSSYYAKATLLL